MKKNRENVFTSIFCVLFIIVAAGLFINAFLFSYENSISTYEYGIMRKDNVVFNIVFSAIALIIIYFISAFTERFVTYKSLHIFAIFLALLCVTVAIIWVTISKAVPRGDQEQVYRIALCFEDGDFSSLQKGGYISRCRQNLGLITVSRFLFRITGNQDYKVFQFFNAISIFLVVYFGFRIVAILSKKSVRACTIFLLLVACCIPMYGYAPFYYGDLCSTAFLITATFAFLHLCEKFSWISSILLTVSITIMVMLRTNTLIPLIAFGIVVICKIVFNYKKRYLIVLLALFVGVSGFKIIQNALYNQHIPEDSKKMPATLYIAMGMHEDEEGGVGRYDNTNDIIFKANDFDPVAASEEAKRDITEHLYFFRSNPTYTFEFLRKKISDQWNMPMYQCLPATRYFYEEPTPFARSIYTYEDKGRYVELFMNYHQLLIYGGTLLFAILSLSKKSKDGIEKQVMLIGVFGGFLFSIIWEAKARYMFPYFIMMIPYAAEGISGLFQKVSDWALGRGK